MKRCPTLMIIGLIHLVCILSIWDSGHSGSHPRYPADTILLAQQDEGDLDESFDLYGPDPDEDIEYDDALISPADSTGEQPTPARDEALIDSLMAGIVWLGHASFLIGNGVTLYIDPFDLPGDLPPADIILITHEHSDHFSPDDLARLVKPASVVVALEALRDRLPKSVKHFRGVAPGDTIEVGDVTIAAVPAYNVEKRFHPKEKGWIGFVIEIAGRSIYHAGDTDLIPEMEGIDADVALLPVGGTYTMDASEAARAADLIRPKVAVPMHWGKIVGTEKDAEAFKAKSSVPVVILQVRPEQAEPKDE